MGSASSRMGSIAREKFSQSSIVRPSLSIKKRRYHSVPSFSKRTSQSSTPIFSATGRASSVQVCAVFFFFSAKKTPPENFFGKQKGAGFLFPLLHTTILLCIYYHRKKKNARVLSLKFLIFPYFMRNFRFFAIHRAYQSTNLSRTQSIRRCAG